MLDRKFQLDWSKTLPHFCPSRSIELGFIDLFCFCTILSTFYISGIISVGSIWIDFLIYYKWLIILILIISTEIKCALELVEWLKEILVELGCLFRLFISLVEFFVWLDCLFVLAWGEYRISCCRQYITFLFCKRFVFLLIYIDWITKKLKFKNYKKVECAKISWVTK